MEHDSDALSGEGDVLNEVSEIAELLQQLQALVSVIQRLPTVRDKLHPRQRIGFWE